MTGTDVRTGSCRYLLNQQTLNIADVPLIVCSAASEGVMEAVSSRISHIVVLDALCTCVGVAKYDETTAQIEKNSEIINRMRY